MPKIKTVFRLVNILDLNCTCSVKDLENKVFKDDLEKFLEWVKKKRTYANIESIDNVLLSDVYIYKKKEKIRYAKEAKKSKITFEKLISYDELRAKEINEVISLKISRDEKIRRIEEIKNKYKKI